MDRHGDLGEPYEISKRVIFVWEDLLAKLSPERQGAEERAIKMRMWKRAYRLWEEDDLMRALVHDVGWRLHQVPDVLITHPQPFAELVEAHMEATSFTYGRVINLSLEDFERWLVRHPEVSTVWHGYRNRPFLFGSKGQVLDVPGRVTAHG